MSRRSFLMSLASSAIPGLDPNAISRQATKITVSVTVELGAEKGQPLGTLFQLRRSQSNQIVAAVGVPQFFSHYVRNNTRMLHFHGRTADESAFTVQELGTPRTDNPRYHCFTFDGVLIDGTNRQFYDEGTQEWANLPNPWNGATFATGEQINYASRIEGKVFVVTDKGVYYDGTKILNYPGPTYKSSNGSVLYYDGLLFANRDDGTLRTYAWTPGSSVGSPINSFTLLSGHFLRAFGILNGTVYAVSGYGRFLRYDRVANAWSYVTQSESVNEFYCLYGLFDELRLGDYPNGHVWRHTGSGELVRLPNYPSPEPGAGPNVREIQSAVLYGGDEVLPLFPWGVVHRRDLATGDWYNQRLYTAPSIDTSNGPYVDSLGTMDWRQRIPSCGLYKDGAFFTGSNTPGDLTAAQHASVPNRAEYGKVWLLRRPHAASAEFDWKQGNTTFTLEISSAGIVLEQDSVVLGSVAGFAPSDFEGSDPITIQAGSGLYGPLEATLIGYNVDQQF